MGDTSNGGGVALPQEVTDSISAAQAEPTATSSQVPGIVSSGPLPGGVSAMPIDASTNIQVSIPANPTFTVSGGQVALTLTARILGPDGSLNYCRWDFTVSIANGYTFFSDLAPGYLLSAAVTCNTAGVPDGAIFAVVGLIHQPNAGLPLDTLLCASYVTSLIPIGWPNGILRTLTDGNGAPFFALQTLPSPGQPMLYQVVDQTIRLTTININLQCSIAAGNRVLQVRLLPAGGGSPIVCFSPTVQTAGQTMNYVISTAVDPAALTTEGLITFPFPSDLFVSAPSGILVQVINMDVADQLGNMVLFGEAWL